MLEKAIVGETNYTIEINVQPRSWSQPARC